MHFSQIDSGHFPLGRCRSLAEKSCTCPNCRPRMRSDGRDLLGNYYLSFSVAIARPFSRELESSLPLQPSFEELHPWGRLRHIHHRAHNYQGRSWFFFLSWISRGSILWPLLDTYQHIYHNPNTLNDLAPTDNVCLLVASPKSLFHLLPTLLFLRVFQFF